MNSPNREHIKKVVAQWRQAGPELERVRREELRRWKYDPDIVDALLQIGDQFGKSRPTSGLVEMQKWFMKLAQKQGLLPGMVREDEPEYRTHTSSGAKKARKCRGGH
jgi:hypothetical protein